MYARVEYLFYLVLFARSTRCELDVPWAGVVVVTGTSTDLKEQATIFIWSPGGEAVRL